MLQNATTKCLLNVSQNASQNASPQDASKCFPTRFQNAAKGFECLFGIALECFKLLQNKFVFFVNYSDVNSKNFIGTDEETISGPFI